VIVVGQRLPILIATKPVDFRCGHQALALIVQTELKLDPHSGVTVSKAMSNAARRTRPMPGPSAKRYRARPCGLFP
jgi:transposase